MKPITPTTPMPDDASPAKTMKVAILGLGAMGARMASRLRGEGIELRVWSRSGVPSAFPLLEPGSATTPLAAVKDADVVISVVTDDEASRAVWVDGGVLSGMRPGAVAMECSTLSPVWVSQLAERARHAGIDFVDAPVVGSRPQAEAGSLIFLAGGDAAVVDRLRPTLLRVGSAVHHVGASPAGARTKLMANALFAMQVAAIGELLGLAQRTGVNVEGLVRVLGELPVTSPAAKGAAAGMLAGDFEPKFPLRLAAKDLRYALAEAEAVGGDVPLTRATSQVFQQGAAHHLDDANLTAVAKLFLAQ